MRWLRGFTEFRFFVIVAENRNILGGVKYSFFKGSMMRMTKLNKN